MIWGMYIEIKSPTFARRGVGGDMIFSVPVPTLYGRLEGYIKSVLLLSVAAEETRIET